MNGGAPDTGDEGASAGEDRLQEILRYYRAVAPVIDREPARADELPFWRREVGRSNPRSVLELGCGTGRITAALADESSRVAGLDLSPDMLRRARSRLPDDPSVSLIRGDVRRLPVETGWDVALAADGLFGHLTTDDDRQAALEEIAAILSPSGRFLMEGLWLPDPVFRRACREGWSRTRSLDRPEPGVLEEVRELWRCDRDSRICRARYEYGPEEGPSRISSEFRARIWDEREVVDRLAEAGLPVRRRWGDFGRGEFRPEESRHLIVAAGRS